MQSHLSVENWSGDRLMPFLPGSCWPSCGQQAFTSGQSRSAEDSTTALQMSCGTLGAHHCGHLPCSSLIPATSPFHSTREFQQMFGP